MPDRYCESEPHGKGFRCPVCLSPHRLDRKGRVPARKCEESTRRINERLKLGPCIHAAGPAEKIVCPTCTGRIEIKTFACNCPEVPQQRASWSDKHLPDVAKCGGCDWYVASVPPEQVVDAPAELPPLSADLSPPSNEA